MTNWTVRKIHHFNFSSSSGLEFWTNKPFFFIADILIISNRWAKMWCVDDSNIKMQASLIWIGETVDMMFISTSTWCLSAHQHGEMALMAVIAQQPVTQEPDVSTRLEHFLQDFWNRKINKHTCWWFKPIIVMTDFWTRIIINVIIHN